MSEKKKKRRLRRKQLKKRFFTKNRLLIINEESLEEVFSLRLTLMNVFIVATLGAVLIIFVTTYIIAFTPLREYIPGYASTELKRNATALAIKSDSLSTVIRNNELYIASIKKILTGDLDVAKFNKDSIQPDVPASGEVPGPTEDELRLREEVSRQDKYNLFEQAKPSATTVFFSPVKGMVTDRFNARTRHFAVDVAVPVNTPIKSVLGGNVIFADWTPSTGNVIIIRHSNGFISAYKHAASLTKNQGDVVRTGEVVALAGSTGNESTGVHLHFELWKDGYPVDPQTFISFE